MKVAIARISHLVKTLHLTGNRIFRSPISVDRLRWPGHGVGVTSCQPRGAS